MRSAWRAIDPVELWARRRLMWTLAARDITVRYKQAVLGALWAIVRPVLLMIVFTYLFGTLADLSTHGAPYPLYVFSALIAWDLFANIVQGSANSVISQKALVEKIYCPRLLFPIVAVLVACFDFILAFGIYCILMLLLGYPPPQNIVWLPGFVLLVILVGFSIGVWLAAVAVWFRDVRYAVTYLLQVMLLLTPVGYAASIVPERWSFIVTLNPMAPLLEGFRWALLGTPGPQMQALGWGIGAATIMLIGGLIFFNALERTFSDVI
jgi:lipopolysaccharide transport system permease protein